MAKKLETKEMLVEIGYKSGTYRKIQAEVCPFCGEVVGKLAYDHGDLTEIDHEIAGYRCDSSPTHITRVPSGDVYRDSDGDLWLNSEWQDYDITKYDISPITKAEVIESIQDEIERKQRSADGWRHILERFNENP